MANQMVAKFRKSSTLIILAKHKVSGTKEGTDYKALLLKRSPQSSFMPNSAVFPGGIFEAADETPLWRKHFEHMGVTKEKLQFLIEEQGPKSEIYVNDNPKAIERELSLRIAAIREAFEELGVIFCRDRKSLNGTGDEGYGRFKEDFDRKHWQKAVHNDASQFLELCQQYEIVPDLWSLNTWSNWLTPASFKKRFDTAFYIIALNKIPEVIEEQNEVSDFAWRTPAEYLQLHFRKELWLPPPQIYELSRLLNFKKLEDLKNFAQKRSSKGVSLMLPVAFQCKDCQVNVLPGDDLYPKEPNAISHITTVDKTAKEFLRDVKNIHRFEYYSLHDVLMRFNIKPLYEHVPPINMNPNKH